MILVDAFWLLHKSRHTLDFLKNTKGRKTGMEYGFLKQCEGLEQEFGDLVLCWEGKSFRKKLYPPYKANRKESIDKGRVAEFKEFCKQVYKWAEHPELEADDVMASLCGNGKTIIYSNDKDMLQCIDATTFVLKSYKEKKFPWDADEVEHKYFGLTPPELPIFFSWVGDAVDNIPGSGIRRSRIASAIVWARGGKRRMRDWPVWNANELDILDTFTPRLDLIKLRIEKVDIVDPIWDKSAIEDWLVMMEICSLKICGQVGMFRMDKEEF
jgi:5'-3' exonuclease